MSIDYPTNSKNIKSWAEDDRPREKLVLKGKSALSSAELLAIIIGSGNRQESAVDLAKRILTDVENNWHELGRKTITDLCRYNGIGKAKAISIITALEIGSRKSHQLALEKPKISDSSSAFDVLHPLMVDLSTEEFWVMFLNQSNKVISVNKMSDGGISHAMVDHRLIFAKALEKLATGIIISHNHPSGNISPSQQDIRLTKLIKDAGEIMNVKLLDHIIIGVNGYFSFLDEGKLI